MHYSHKALQKLGEVLKSLELEPLVRAQQAIREYLEAAGARGGLSEMEVAALATLYAANEALFPTSVLDILTGAIKGDISDIATDPASSRVPGRGGREVVRGTREGIDIEVIVEPGGRIVTGYLPRRLHRKRTRL